METHPGEGVVKEEKFPNTGNPLTGRSVGTFGISEGNITWIKRKKKTQIMRLTATPRGEVAQMLVPTSSEQGLNREVWAACLG